VPVALVWWNSAAGFFGGAAEWRRRLLLADVAQAPLADRQGMLLRLKLTRAQRLPAAEGLAASAIAVARLDSTTNAMLCASAPAAVRFCHFASPVDIEALVTAKALLANFARQGGR
jgi:hypothetical protein